MKKRLRKKKKIGQFSEHGFKIKFSFPQENAEACMEQFLDGINKLGFCFCGGINLIDCNGRGIITITRKRNPFNLKWLPSENPYEIDRWRFEKEIQKIIKFKSYEFLYYIDLNSGKII